MEFKEIIMIQRFNTLSKRADKGFYLRISFVYEVVDNEIIARSQKKVSYSVNLFLKILVSFTANAAIMKIKDVFTLIILIIMVIIILVVVVLMQFVVNIPLSFQIYWS